MVVVMVKEVMVMVKEVIVVVVGCVGGYGVVIGCCF
jgi:hypothetical protein